MSARRFREKNYPLLHPHRLLSPKKTNARAAEET